MTTSSEFSAQQFQQLFQAVTETRDAVTALNSELSSGVLYSYVNWSSTPPLLKIGFSRDLKKRCKHHVARGYQYLSQGKGPIATEKRLKLALLQSGFRPIAGDETYQLTKELLIFLYQFGWPIGDLKNQMDTFGFQTTLDLLKHNQSDYE